MKIINEDKKEIHKKIVGIDNFDKIIGTINEIRKVNKSIKIPL